MRLRLLLLFVLFPIAAPTIAQAPKPNGAERRTTPGSGPYGVLQVTFFVHRLGTDHAEGVTTLDMNGDGYSDILSGAYWYENPGLSGGEWKWHQYREAGIHDEYVSDCGEWTAVQFYRFPQVSTPLLPVQIRQFVEACLN
jgi:hypothetical protein